MICQCPCYAPARAPPRTFHRRRSHSRVPPPHCPDTAASTPPPPPVSAACQVLGYCAETWNCELNQSYLHLHKQHIDLLKEHAALLNEKVSLLRENNELNRRARVFEQAWQATVAVLAVRASAPDVD